MGQTIPDHSVDRNLLTGAHLHQLAGTDLVGRYLLFGMISPDAREANCRRDFRFHGFGCALPRARIEVLAEDDQDEDHRSGVVVNIRTAAEGFKCRGEDRCQSSAGDQRFQHECAATGGANGDPQHWDAQQKVDGDRKPQHDP